MYAFTSMGVVVISTVVFILSTMPELTDDIDMILFTNSTDNDNENIEFVHNIDARMIPPQQPVERWEDVSLLQSLLHLLF